MQIAECGVTFRNPCLSGRQAQSPPAEELVRRAGEIRNDERSYKCSILSG